MMARVNPSHSSNLLKRLLVVDTTPFRCSSWKQLAIQTVIKPAYLARPARDQLYSGLFCQNISTFSTLKYRSIHIMRDYTAPVRVRRTGVRRGNTPRLQGAG